MYPNKRPNTKLQQRLLVTIFFILGSIIGFSSVYLPYSQQPKTDIPSTSRGRTWVTWRFSPKGGCQEKIVAAINSAKKRIYGFAYSFTSKPIADALIAAQKRGVIVQLIVSKGEYERKKKDQQINRLTQHGVRCYQDSRTSFAHNKVLIIDGKQVITGSFNFDSSAEQENRENIVHIYSEQTAATFSKYWTEQKASLPRENKKESKRKK